MLPKGTLATGTPSANGALCGLKKQARGAVHCDRVHATKTLQGDKGLQMRHTRATVSISIVCALVALGSPAATSAHAAEPIGPVTARVSALPDLSPAMAFPASIKSRTGSLRLTVSGLPKKAHAKITVVGPSGKKSVTKSTTLKKLKAGIYSITVRDLKVGKQWYRGVDQSTNKGVAAGKTATLRVRYHKASDPTPAPVTPTTPVRFSFAGAVGVAIAGGGATASTVSRTGRGTQPASASPSALLAVHADGTTASAVASGSLALTPTRIYRGPDAAVVLEFAGTVDPKTGQRDTRGCALLRIAPNSESAECVDPTLVEIPHTLGGQYLANPIVQFDDSGAVYYLGYTQESPAAENPGPMKLVFRRSGGETVTDIAPNVIATTSASHFASAVNFAVAGNGTVYFTGAGTDPYGSVFRVLPDGTTTLILSGQNIGFMSVLADGNFYFGATHGVYRFDASAGQLDSRRWLGTYRSWDGISAATYDCDELAVAVTGDSLASCPAISNPRALVSTGDGHALGDIPLDWSGGNWPSASRGVLVRYYPNPTLIRTTVRIESAIVAAGSKIILAGTDDSGTPHLVSLDEDSGDEQALLAQDQQVDIYHLVFSAREGLVMFDGLRFADNRYVIGSVNLTTGAVQMTPAAKLSDFQAF